MQAQLVSFKKFISTPSLTFVIPVYQRNYDWEKDNCEQLFKDVLNITHKTQETHFIGAVCHKMDGRSKSIVIDGQQRITSVMLLLKALYDLSIDGDLKNRIKTQVLINPYSKSNDLKIKLKPIKKDENIYVKLIMSDPFNEASFDRNEKNSNIYRNYECFKELIRQSIKNDFSESDIEDAIDRLEIVELTLNAENPQVIFESLNSTGLDLTNVDLLRNYLLMSLDYNIQEELYLNYWLKIEEMIGSENMENFITHYLILKRKSVSVALEGKTSKINSKSLYYAFKKYLPQNDIKQKEKIEEHFKDMLKYAQYYKHFIFNDNSVFNGLDEKFYEIFYFLEESDSAIITMYFYDLYENKKIDKMTFLNLLDITITFIFRGIVCGRKGFSKQFAALTIQKIDNLNCFDNFEKKYLDILTSGKGSYSIPKDEEFKETLETKDLYNSLRSKKCKYLLYKLEKNINQKECPFYTYGTIEHIMPKTLTQEWIQYLNKKTDYSNYSSYVHTLGNLTLTGYNSELSNDLFEDKKNEYINSNYFYTRELANYSDWTSKQIIQRASNLSKEALKIWKLPDEYNKNILIDTGVTYNLEANFEDFKGLKLDTISVFDNQKQINNWSEFVVEVANAFYELDSELFIELERYDFPFKKNIISSDKTTMNKCVEIASSGLFINTNNSTIDHLKIIECIIKYFEKNTSANFIEDIWFTIRRIK